MTERPVLTVCIPAYNQPELLQRALASSLGQSLTDIEVLIVDDSTTDSIEQLAPLLTVDSRVVYKRNHPTLGPAANWNRVMARARGRFIKFMHHDDWFTRDDALELFVAAAESSGSSFSFCASRSIDPSGVVVSENRPPPGFRDRLLRRPTSLLATGNLIGGPSATMFRRDPSIIFDVNLRWLVDLDFYVSYLERHKTLAYIDQVLVNTTAGAPHQVTATSFGNLCVEVNEWDVLYRKHRPRAHVQRMRKFVTLARRYSSDTTNLSGLADPRRMTLAALGLGALEGRLQSRCRSMWRAGSAE